MPRQLTLLFLLLGWLMDAPALTGGAGSRIDHAQSSSRYLPVAACHHATFSSGCAVGVLIQMEFPPVPDDSLMQPLTIPNTFKGYHHRIVDWVRGLTLAWHDSAHHCPSPLYIYHLNTPQLPEAFFRSFLWKRVDIWVIYASTDILASMIQADSLWQRQFIVLRPFAQVPDLRHPGWFQLLPSPEIQWLALLSDFYPQDTIYFLHFTPATAYTRFFARALHRIVPCYPERVRQLQFPADPVFQFQQIEPYLSRDTFRIFLPEVHPARLFNILEQIGPQTEDYPIQITGLAVWRRLITVPGRLQQVHATMLAPFRPLSDSLMAVLLDMYARHFYSLPADPYYFALGIDLAMWLRQWFTDTTNSIPLDFSGLTLTLSFTSSPFLRSTDTTQGWTLQPIDNQHDTIAANISTDTPESVLNHRTEWIPTRWENTTLFLWQYQEGKFYVRDTFQLKATYYDNRNKSSQAWRPRRPCPH